MSALHCIAAELVMCPLWITVFVTQCAVYLLYVVLFSIRGNHIELTALHYGDVSVSTGLEYRNEFWDFSGYVS